MSSPQPEPVTTLLHGSPPSLTTIFDRLHEHSWAPSAENTHAESYWLANRPPKVGCLNPSADVLARRDFRRLLVVIHAVINSSMLLFALTVQ